MNHALQEPAARSDPSRTDHVPWLSLRWWDDLVGLGSKGLLAAGSQAASCLRTLDRLVGSWSGVGRSTSAGCARDASDQPTWNPGPMQQTSGSFTVSVRHLIGYVRVEAAGHALAADLMATTEMGGALNAHPSSRRVMVNAAHLNARLSFSEQVQLGAQLACKLAGFDRVAIVARSAARARTVAAAARELGLEQLRVFTQVAVAAKWLEEPVDTSRQSLLPGGS